jgi:hypothetical protein
MNTGQPSFDLKVGYKKPEEHIWAKDNYIITNYRDFICVKCGLIAMSIGTSHFITDMDVDDTFCLDSCDEHILKKVLL